MLGSSPKPVRCGTNIAKRAGRPPRPPGYPRQPAERDLHPETHAPQPVAVFNPRSAHSIIRKRDSGAVVFRPEANVQEVRQAVDRAVDERSAEMIKFCDQPEQFMSYKPGAAVMTQAQLEAAADQARKRGIPITIHNVTVAGFRQSLQAGMTSLAHIPIDRELDDADLRLFADSDTFVEPTLTVGFYYCWSMKGNPWHDHPEIKWLDGFREPTYQAMVEES